jgi:hypothetical protein
MTSRYFLYVCLVVAASVAVAYGYRLYKDEQCCGGALAPVADGAEQGVELAQDRAMDPLPSGRPDLAAD